MDGKDALPSRCGGQKKLRSYLFGLFIFMLFVFGYYSHRTATINITMEATIQPVPTEPSNTVPLYPYVIEEESKCSEETPFLLLLIPSSPQDAVIRSNLRKIWAGESLIAGISIKKLFLLGSSTNNDTQQAVKEESSVFHDIIQQDFLDTYLNLTLKTLMGMEWVSRLCNKVNYVMKIDSDMFFNPWFLVQQVLQPKESQKVGFFSGSVIEGAIPFRDKGNKWYISELIFPKKHYPPYCSGTGYVFSGDLAPMIYKAALKITLFPFEDVFVGMCLEKIGIKITKPAGFWFSQDRLKYNGCQFAKMVTIHQYNIDELVKLWPDFLKALNNCT